MRSTPVGGLYYPGESDGELRLPELGVTCQVKHVGGAHHPEDLKTVRDVAGIVAAAGEMVNFRQDNMGNTEEA